MSDSADDSGGDEHEHLGAVWAKAGTGNLPHPLVCHGIDTAIVAELIFDRVLGPALRDHLSRALAPLGDTGTWTALLCGLHDLGKCSPTFQGLRQEIAERLLTEAEGLDVRHLRQGGEELCGIRTDLPHGLLTALHMERLLIEWGASRRTARAIAQVLGGHHGYVPAASQIRYARSADGHSGGKPWQARCDEIVSAQLALWGIKEPAALPWADVQLDIHAELALASLTSISDWIASSRPPREYEGESVDLLAYVARARSSERKRVDDLQWEPWVPPSDTTFRGLFPAGEPRPIQQALENVVDECDGAGVFVISAPTGEGKTKAGLQAVASLVRKLDLNGFYLAMPNKVSSNQGFEVARQLLAGQEHLLHLFHSSSVEYLRTRGSYVAAPQVQTHEVAADGDGQRDDDDDAVSLGDSWFSSLRKRVLLAPAAVGTVDQALMAAIRSGHIFVRLAGLSNKVVLFDEVHGYDVHMSALLSRLLCWLGSMRTPVLLMSATLSSRQQEALVGSWYAGARGQMPEEALPLRITGRAGYPQLLSADSSEAAPQRVAVGTSELNMNRKVELEMVGFGERVDYAFQEARRGRCVAVIHNVVAHADAAWKELTARVAKLPEENRPLTKLLHARLEEGQRAAAEEWIRRHFGADRSERPGAGAVVVGSQLLEQSLDVDFDVVISAVAPIDSLIQRMGRIHRHRPVKAGDPPLRMLLTGFPEMNRGTLKFPPHTTRVYDKAVLLRTCAVLRGRTAVKTPEDVQQLIDQVYDVEAAGAELKPPSGWEKEWQQAERTRRQRVGSDDLLGSEEYVSQMIRLPAPMALGRLQDLTDLPESARRTRRDSGRRGLGDA